MDIFLQCSRVNNDSPACRVKILKRKNTMRLVPEINHEKCTRCGKCIAICPKDVLELRDKKVVLNAEECLLCSHCFDVCPEDAVSFEDAVLTAPEFSSFQYKEKIIDGGKLKAGDVVNLLRSRRSIRKYTEKRVDDQILEDLVTAGITAPSGSNCQAWEFTIVNGRDKVWDIAQDIKKFFLRLNSLARNPVTRYGTIPFMGKTLLNYYNNHYESVCLALEESDRGIDRLFHGAPALIICHGPVDGSTPLEDAQYATYNMTLLGHTLGLGTCYIGYAVESINRMKYLKEKLHIAPDSRVLAVITVGWPDAVFERFSLRKPWKVYEV